MSSLAGRLSTPRLGRRAGPRTLIARSRAAAVAAARADAAVCAGVALAVAGVALGASGGTQLARTTYTEMLMMIGGAVLVAVALVTPHAREQRLHGG
ncbi:MAG TPA: hypothetical protein VF533_15030, partial [Solirubrobacteraceae bacterium]